MKQLLEKRSKLIEKVEAIMEVAETEIRALSKEELDKINGYKVWLKVMRKHLREYETIRSRFKYS